MDHPLARSAAIIPVVARTPKICADERCDEYAVAKGLCNRHYQALWREAKRKCMIEGCEAKPYARRLCADHHEAWRAQQKAKTQRANLTATTMVGEELVTYLPEEKVPAVKIDQGLMALVLCGGRAKEAAQHVGVTERTLNRWKQDNPGRYLEIQRDKGAEIEAMALDSLRAFVVASEHVKVVALEKTLEYLESGKPRDPSAVLRNVATSQGLAISKLLELSGRPTSVTEHRNLDELLARLKHLGATVDGIAVEVPSGDTVLESIEDVTDA